MTNTVVPDQTAENGEQCRHWSDCWKFQTVKIQIRLLRMTNSVDPDQTVPENDSVDQDLDQIAENGK